MQEAYFTFSYSPLFLEDNSVGGIFCSCSETTSRVIGERQLRYYGSRTRQGALPRNQSIH